MVVVLVIEVKPPFIGQVLELPLGALFKPINSLNLSQQMFFEDPTAVVDLRRRDGRGRSEAHASSSRRNVAGNGARTDSTVVIAAREVWRRSVLNRVVVFAATPGATFLALLLELLLSLGVGEAKEEFDAIGFDREVVVFFDDLLSDLAGFKTVMISGEGASRGWKTVPGKADFLADTRWDVAADLGRDSFPWKEVLIEILDLVSSKQLGKRYDTHILIPLNGNTSAVDVG